MDDSLNQARFFGFFRGLGTRLFWLGLLLAFTGATLVGLTLFLSAPGFGGVAFLDAAGATAANLEDALTVAGFVDGLAEADFAWEELLLAADLALEAATGLWISALPPYFALSYPGSW